jgi:DNA-binding transcriptional LysR family regulator
VTTFISVSLASHDRIHVSTGCDNVFRWPQSLTVPLLAPVIRRWHRRHPDVAITLRVSAVPDEIFGLIDSDEADVVLVPLPVPGRFTATAVADEEIVLAAPSGHPLARQPTVRIQDRPVPR